MIVWRLSHPNFPTQSAQLTGSYEGYKELLKTAPSSPEGLVEIFAISKAGHRHERYELMKKVILRPCLLRTGTFVDTWARNNRSNLVMVYPKIEGNTPFHPMFMVFFFGWLQRWTQETTSRWWRAFHPSWRFLRTGYDCLWKWGYPNSWMVYNGKSYSKGWELGVASFIFIYGNPHISNYASYDQAMRGASHPWLAN
jgi:hypothetical protein